MTTSSSFTFSYQYVVTLGKPTKLQAFEHINTHILSVYETTPLPYLQNMLSYIGVYLY